ncbi:MAG TPA: amidohydrolase [Vicinamibacteria bacterium]|nr:amidohydrolase [Vicinamibacteria bacterium]
MLLALTLVLAAATPAGTPDAEIRAAAERLAPAVVATRRELHAHPELSNREERTGRLVAARLRALGIEVRYPVAHTGVVGVLPGGRPGGVVALRADMDALPIEEKTGAAYRSQAPGVMHACGHDAHTAMLLGAAEVLAGLRARLPGTVVFLFQPAEEGAPEGEEGGAPLMVKEGALDQPKVEAVFGLHVGGWVAVGQAGWTDGPIYASSDTFAIEVAGKTVHGAEPWKGLDPIPVAAEIVEALQTIVSREIDGRQPRVLTIGRIQGGTRFNVIADHVTLDGTMRTHDPEVRRAMKASLERIVHGVAEAHGTTASLRFLDAGNPPTVNDPALARLAVPVLKRVFGTGAVPVQPQMVAEDFTYYGERAPIFFFLLGTRNDARGIASRNHSAEFEIDEAALPLGVRALSSLAWEFLASRPAAR